ncbi:hypothetical protein V3C99_010425 [Haemonchus contortus]
MSTHTTHSTSQFQKPSHLQWTYGATSADSLQVTKRRPSVRTLELIRQRGIARAAGNHQLRSELAKLCREAIKEDLEKRRATVLSEVAWASKSIRKARRSFANYKTKMTSLRRADGIGTASRRGIEEVTSTRISSTATSTCLPNILGKTYVSLHRFSLPKHHHAITSTMNCTVQYNQSRARCYKT